MKFVLTKNEKTALRSIAQDGIKKPFGMIFDSFFLATLSLSQKGLVEAVFNYDKIISAKLTYIGRAYLTENPTLKNPIDWYKILTLIAMIITAVCTALALFIGCQALNN